MAMTAALNSVTLQDMALSPSSFLESESGRRLTILREVVRPVTPCKTQDEGDCACHQAAETVRKFSQSPNSHSTTTGA